MIVGESCDNAPPRICIKAACPSGEPGLPVEYAERLAKSSPSSADRKPTSFEIFRKIKNRKIASGLDNGIVCHCRGILHKSASLDPFPCGF
jgi:hypothetical protein